MINLLIAAILLAAIELVYFKLADKFNIIDKPNQRSSHKTITLRGGGIIFLFAIWLYAAIYGFNYPLFLLGITLIAVISFADDIAPMQNRVRIVIHFMSMLLMFGQLGLLNREMWYIAIIALIICTYIINAFNFMDGINGMTGGYSLAVLLPLAIANSKIAVVDQNLIYMLMLSVMIFSFFNFRKKAKCFAGDVGAVTIAFAIIFLIFTFIIKTDNLLWIMLLVVYGIDSVMTILHRLMLKENIFKAHRKHAYQLMANELKIPHIAVASIYAGIQLIVSIGLMFMNVNKWIYSIAVIVVLGMAYVIFIIKNYHLHEEYLRAQNK